MQTLTNGQKQALLESQNGHNIFISGGGGVGKSYISQIIVDELQATGKTVLITASTGKAAMLINGVTCHRAFRIPIRMTWSATPKITPKDPIYESDVILIDEVSMLRIDAFDFICKSIQKVNKIRKSNIYLANPKNKHRDPIQLIVIGDFGQLPPVIVHTNDGRPDEGDLMSQHYGFPVKSGYAFLAPGWKECNFVKCELTEVMRQSNKDMIHALQGIRLGDRSFLPYFTENSRKKPFSDSDEAICLCGRNKTADQINAAKIAKLPGKARTYQAQIAGDVSAQDKPAPDQLHLKKSVRVIMLQNTDKYRNGSSAIVTSLGNDEITVKIDESDELVTVPYANWDVERYAVDPSTNKVTKEIIGTFRQLPVRPGYAITIHKSQGQSLDKVTLKLGNRWPEIFSCGQLYVALSRATSMDGLYIDGSLEKIKVLASEDFLNFQNNALDTCVNSTNSEEIPVSEEQPEDTTKEPSASDGRTISIKCPAHAAKAIFSFAQALTPDTKLVDSVLILPEEYKQAVKTFIEVIL